MNRSRNILIAAIIVLAAFISLAPDAVAMNEPWQVEGNQADAHLGQSIASAGDVNGDGYDDLLIGERHDYGAGGRGVAFAYYGSSQGLGQTPDWTDSSGQPDMYSFLALDSAGDVNGDGYDDVIIGEGYYDGGETDEGRAALYYGSPDGLASSPAWFVEGNQAIMYFGTDVAGVGDVNGDGYDDLLVGAPYKKDAEGYVVGQALLYFGSPSGPSVNPNWTVEGIRSWNYFGGHIGAAGDVNGDGYADFMVSDYNFTNQASGEGRVFLFFGGPKGPATFADWTADGGQADAHFGTVVDSAGDVNNDGYDDIIITAYGYSGSVGHEGGAFVYYGSPTGPGSDPDWTAAGGQFYGYFGSAAASAGDVNADGYDDVIVGADAYSDGELSEGRAYLYLGSASGLSANPEWTVEGNQAQARFGNSVASAGDLNGNGLDAWAVGAWNYDSGETDEGIAVVYSSLSPDPLPTPTATPPLPPTPTPEPVAVHIGDLDGSATTSGNQWSATVTILVRDANNGAISGAVVSGTWDTGSAAQCTSAGFGGGCVVSLSGLPKQNCCVTFTVEDVQYSQGYYDPSANTDPDGDSNGTWIVVDRRARRNH